jgi:hypothetical protein
VLFIGHAVGPQFFLALDAKGLRLGLLWSKPAKAGKKK